MDTGSRKEPGGVGGNHPLALWAGWQIFREDSSCGTLGFRVLSRDL